MRNIGLCFGCSLPVDSRCTSEALDCDSQSQRDDVGQDSRGSDAPLRVSEPPFMGLTDSFCCLVPLGLLVTPKKEGINLSKGWGLLLPRFGDWHGYEPKLPRQRVLLLTLSSLHALGPSPHSLVHKTRGS
jgi:hypothetical protein